MKFKMKTDKDFFIDTEGIDMGIHIAGRNAFKLIDESLEENVKTRKECETAGILCKRIHYNVKNEEYDIAYELIMILSRLYSPCTCCEAVSFNQGYSFGKELFVDGFDFALEQTYPDFVNEEDETPCSGKEECDEDED